MTTTIKHYELKLDGTGGLQEIHAERYNNLPIGTVIQCQGYDYPEYCIVLNTGTDSRWPGYGDKYTCVNRKTYSIRGITASELHHIDENRPGIHLAILNKVLPAEQVKFIKEEAARVEELRIKKEIEQKRIKEEKIEKGRELFKLHIPKDCPALIVAELHQNESDSMTDYFAHSISKYVILAASKHTKNNFREMRKAAKNFKETEYLATAPKDAEHRENWSMGGGYYLKDGYRHESTWSISKHCKYGKDWNEFAYISMAETCVFETIN